jgi:hypothetical protein
MDGFLSTLAFAALIAAQFLAVVLVEHGPADEQVDGGATAPVRRATPARIMAA